MKALFCTDVTLDQNNEEKIGKEFIVKEVSFISKNRIQENRDRINEVYDKTSIPNSLLLITIFSFFIGLLILLLTANKHQGVLFKDAFSASPIPFTIGGAFFTLSVVLLIFSLIKNGRIHRKYNMDGLLENLRENIKQNHIELGVPFDSDKAEILIFKYKEEDGMPKAIHILNQCTYFNITYKFFTTPGYLNIADSECIYSFGLHELKRIITVNEYYCILGIDRDEVFRYERFPKNEVSRNTARDLNLREYHILEIERNGETYGLYFPTYELNFFEWITGLTA